MIQQQILVLPKAAQRRLSQLEEELRDALAAQDSQATARLLAERDALQAHAVARPLAPGDEF